MSSKHEYGPEPKWLIIIGVLAGLFCLVIAVGACAANDAWAALIFGMFGGFFLGMSACPCRITKRGN